MVQRLERYYVQTIVPKMMEQFVYKNKYQVPRLQKIVVNRGIGDAPLNKKLLDSSVLELKNLTGQKGIITRSKNSIAAFKIRKKMPVGVSVILRNEKMYGFLDRLINLALPRIRDFRGISLKSFDGFGNYSLGLDEQLMFPEISYEKVDQIRGMDISIVTTSSLDFESFVLLKHFGFPFKKEKKKFF